MIEKKLHINQKISIVVEDGPYLGTYLCKVAEINNDCLKITAPYLNGELVPLRINLVVNVYFTGKNSAYMFKTKVLERINGPVALMTLECPVHIKRIQRREFFRIEAKRDLKYRLVDKDLNPIDDFKETSTIDISGGGVKIVVDEKFPQKGFVELYLYLPLISNLPIFGKVVNRSKLPDGVAAGIEFIGLDDNIREEIISWLFDYQRELRQKGLL